MNASCQNENTLTRHLVAWQSNKLTFTEFMILPEKELSRPDVVVIQDTP